MSILGTGANLIFGTWGNDFAKEYGKEIANQAGFSPAGTKFGAIKNKETWQAAKSNLTALNANRGNLHPLQLIKDTYTKVNSADYKQAAESTAKAVEKKAGYFSKFLAKHETLSNAVKGLEGKVAGIAVKYPKLANLAKGLKKVPLLGSVLFMLPEIPQIIKAFKQDGIVEGLKQTCRSFAKVGVSSLSFVAGQTAAGVVTQILFPIPGLGFALGIGASILAEKFLSPVIENLPVIAKSKTDESTNANPFNA